MLNTINKIIRVIFTNIQEIKKNIQKKIWY